MSIALKQAQPWLAALVQQDEARSGSRMVAYQNVARAIGASSSWVRKFLGNQPIRLDADTFLSIQARYEAACARWDAEAELQKQRFFALGGGDVNASRNGLATCAGVDGGGSVPARLASVVDEKRQ